MASHLAIRLYPGLNAPRFLLNTEIGPWMKEGLASAHPFCREGRAMQPSTWYRASERRQPTGATNRVSRPAR